MFIKWWQHIRGKMNQFRLISSVVPILLKWEKWLYRNTSRHKYQPHIGPIIRKMQNQLKDINELLNLKADCSSFKKVSRTHLNLKIKQVQVNEPEIVCWELPQADRWKLNIDGSSRNNPGDAGCGGIIRDDKHNIKIAFSEYLGTNSNNYT